MLRCSWVYSHWLALQTDKLVLSGTSVVNCSAFRQITVVIWPVCAAGVRGGTETVSERQTTDSLPTSGDNREQRLSFPWQPANFFCISRAQLSCSSSVCTYNIGEGLRNRKCYFFYFFYFYALGIKNKNSLYLRRLHGAKCRKVLFGSFNI